MKKWILILGIWIGASSLLHGQIAKNGNLGIGVSFGLRMPFGFLGAHVDYSPKVLQHRLELNAGIGILPAVSFGTGLKCRLFSNQRNLELYAAVNYGYQFAGEDMFVDEETEISDAYRFLATQFMRYFVALRIWPDRMIAYEFNAGYVQNIGGMNVIPTNGPNTHIHAAQSNVRGGLMLGVNLYFYPRMRKR